MSLHLGFLLSTARDRQRSQSDVVTLNAFPRGVELGRDSEEPTSVFNPQRAAHIAVVFQINTISPQNLSMIVRLQRKRKRDLVFCSNTVLICC